MALLIGERHKPFEGGVLLYNLQSVTSPARCDRREETSVVTVAFGGHHVPFIQTSEKGCSSGLLALYPLNSSAMP